MLYEVITDGRRQRSELGSGAEGMVTATVKWFNPTKGFGFVTMSDGTPDAFLHISTIEPLGFRNLPQGAVVECEIGDGPRGLQVKTVLAVRNAEADAAGSEA